jgi:hypothetical protein
VSGFAVGLPNQKLDQSSSEATALSSSEMTNPKVIAEMVIMGTGTSIGVPVVGCRVQCAFRTILEIVACDPVC